MQYLLLIYEADDVMQNMSPDDRQAVMSGYQAFTRDIRKSGHFQAGEALDPVTAATSVRIRDGKTLVTDGPFAETPIAETPIAETKEQLGGYYLVEAAAIAARIPTAKTGTIEVRPIMVWD
ncbi:MAG: YciI family protein [Gammaproteobacteria bacterium]